MNETTKELRTTIKNLICETLMTEKTDNCYEIIGMLEDIKIGLVTAMHETSKQMLEKEFKQDPNSLDAYMEKHKKRFEEMLKKAKTKDDNDGTTTTAA